MLVVRLERHPAAHIVATETTAERRDHMFGYPLTGTAQMFSDVRT